MTTGSRRARVLVVDDHPLMVDALRVCLEAEGYDVVAAPLETRDAVLGTAAQLVPDVVLLDVQLGAGIGDATALVEPLVRNGATVVIVSGTTAAPRIGALVEQGAAGFVPKTRSFDAIVATVAAAAEHRPLMTTDERRHLLAQLRAARDRNGALERLSPRESEILAALVDGKTTIEVAGDGYVSEGTVRCQIRSILRKLDVNSQLAAVALAHKARWRQPD
jgi:DNA-binding NarL/FixJ family response regulator